jgi:hypothetical protein
MTLQFRKALPSERHGPDWNDRLGFLVYLSRTSPRSFCALTGELYGNAHILHRLSC